MTSEGPPELGRGRPLEGEIVGPVSESPAPTETPAQKPGDGDDNPPHGDQAQGGSPSVVPVIPLLVVNPLQLTGGEPPHLGPLTDPDDELGATGVPVDPYQGKEQPTPPRAPAAATGSFPYHVKAPTIPTDPVTPYLSAPVKRRRRSEWPVMVFVMVVAAIVMITCCLAGYGIFVRDHPFP